MGYWAGVILLGMTSKAWTVLQRGSQSKGPLESLCHAFRTHVIMPATFAPVSSKHQALWYSHAIPKRVDSFIVLGFWAVTIVLSCVQYDSFTGNIQSVFILMNHLDPHRSFTIFKQDPKPLPTELAVYLRSHWYSIIRLSSIFVAFQWPKQRLLVGNKFYQPVLYYFPPPYCVGLYYPCRGALDQLQCRLCGLWYFGIYSQPIKIKLT